VTTVTTASTALKVRLSVFLCVSMSWSVVDCRLSVSNSRDGAFFSRNKAKKIKPNPNRNVVVERVEKHRNGVNSMELVRSSCLGCEFLDNATIKP
jgi:hypothetical protein